jgi:hypothetical protein
MFTSMARKNQFQHGVSLHLEELETRALLSAVQPSAVFDAVSSTNWSGYAAVTNLNSPASDSVTKVSGSWTVPTVTGKTNAYSSMWVGIDGYSSNSVEQIGTEQDTTKSGATRYYAWWEMYPNPSILISTMTISPGDSITASVTYNGDYLLQITDNTTHQSFSTTQSATAQRSSAEWIMEAPSSFSGILPLANFGTASFSGAQATINGTAGAIDDASWQNTSIDMVKRSGSVIAHTLSLTDTGNTSSFSVSFTGSGGGGGHGHGHGGLQSVAIIAPIASEFTPSTSAEGTAISTTKPQAETVEQRLIVSASTADTWSPSFGPVNELESISGLKNWWETSQSGIMDDIMPLGIQGSDDYDSSI